jgi:lysophospholipid acyltransferase (LPLAT)-like uncharacterized protein
MLAAVLATYARFVLRTTRVDWAGRPDREAIVWACWHEDVFALTLAFIASRSRPLPRLLTLYTRRGAVTTIALRKFGGETIQLTDHEMRGPRGTPKRVVEEYLRSGGACIVTLDGPRGPHRQPKDGAFRMARVAGAELRFARASVTRSLRLHRWDRLTLPLPFAHIVVRESGDPGLLGLTEHATRKG